MVFITYTDIKYVPKSNTKAKRKKIKVYYCKVLKIQMKYDNITWRYNVIISILKNLKATTKETKQSVISDKATKQVKWDQEKLPI